jgi:hypothetical protein
LLSFLRGKKRGTIEESYTSLPLRGAVSDTSIIPILVIALSFILHVAAITQLGEYTKRTLGMKEADV